MRESNFGRFMNKDDSVASLLNCVYIVLFRAISGFYFKSPTAVEIYLQESNIRQWEPISAGKTMDLYLQATNSFRLG